MWRYIITAIELIGFINEYGISKAIKSVVTKLIDICAHEWTSCKKTNPSKAHTTSTKQTKRVHKLENE
jgi:hypothetical protein